MKDLESMTIGNGAGVVKSMLDVERMCRSAATRITVGSGTLLRRDGNLPAPRPTYHYDPVSRASINAVGLLNPGMDEYEKLLPEMISRANDVGKELVFSVAGFSPAEFGQLGQRALSAGVKRVEINLGCPNIHSAEGRKPIFSYDPDLSEEVLSVMKADCGDGQQMSGKISPLEDSQLLLRLMNVLVRSGIVDETLACNTIPDKTLLLPDGEPALAFRAKEDGPVLHTGGLAGEPLRERALSVVKQIKAMSLGGMRVILIGGISQGEHLRGAAEADADGVECATAYVEQGPRVFSTLFEQYAESFEAKPA